MKQILLLLLIVGGLSKAQVSNYDVGDVVDNFTITDTHGVEHTLYDITASGKYVFLDFFFRNCGPCQQTSRYFYELYETYGENQENVYMLSLSPIDNNATIEEFEQLFSGGFTPCPAAGTEGDAPAVITNLGIPAFPTYCIIGPDNTLLVADIWPITDMSTFEDAFPPGLVEILGVNDFTNNSNFSVNPTISDGNFSVNLAEAKKSEISVYDMSGKIVHSGSYNTQNISMGLKVASGIYIMTVTVDGKTNSKKIIVKN